MYTVFDVKLGYVVKTFPTVVRARRWADKKDLEYGAVRYIVKFNA